jgi:type IV secretory pathway TrbD component
VSFGIVTISGLFVAVAFGLAEVLKPGLPVSAALCAILGLAIFLWGARIEPALRIVSFRQLGLSA